MGPGATTNVKTYNVSLLTCWRSPTNVSLLQVEVVHCCRCTVTVTVTHHPTCNSSRSTARFSGVRSVVSNQRH